MILRSHQHRTTTQSHQSATSNQQSATTPSATDMCFGACRGKRSGATTSTGQSAAASLIASTGGDGKTGESKSAAGKPPVNQSQSGVSGGADLKTAHGITSFNSVVGANTSATHSTDVSGFTSSTWSDADGCKWKAHYPPFIDPEVKVMAAMFEKTINAHTYGYAAITTITHIVTLVNPKLDASYRKKAGAIKAETGEVNEILAFHGTPKDSNIESISRNNFDNKKLGLTTGNQGWYGSGVYLTQHAGAALRYQYWNTSVPPNRMLLCRAMLGRVFTVPENSCEFIGKGLTTGFDSHRGRDRWDADWQIVIFDTDSILPCAHVYYK